jgi:hypothetical protein
MERLRIELGGEPQHIVLGDGRLAARKAHPELQVVEPFDHVCPRLKGLTGPGAVTPGSTP